MERSVEVSTGESVAFTYELAGLGSRFFAVFIDLSIQLLVATIVLVILAWIGSTVPPGTRATGGAAKAAEATVDALFIFAGFALFFGYFILFEWRYGGRTPGKRLVGIRVVRDGGFPVDITASVVRNVVRILETALGFYAVSAVVTLFSPNNQRLGDMAAGTLVVRDNRFERTAASVARRERETDDDLVGDLTPGERELVRRYYGRRSSLGAAARLAVAGQIAAAVRPKLSVPFDHLDDDDLLVHLATTALA